jgi:hypothetical protein
LTHSTSLPKRIFDDLADGGSVQVFLSKKVMVLWRVPVFEIRNWDRSMMNTMRVEATHFSDGWHDDKAAGDSADFDTYNPSSAFRRDA